MLSTSDHKLSFPTAFSVWGKEMLTRELPILTSTLMRIENKKSQVQGLGKPHVIDWLKDFSQDKPLRLIF